MTASGDERPQPASRTGESPSAEPRVITEPAAASGVSDVTAAGSEPVWEPETTPEAKRNGRTRKVVLVAAAVAGVLAVSVPFLLMGSGDDGDVKAGGSEKAGATEAYGSGQPDPWKSGSEKEPAAKRAAKSSADEEKGAAEKKPAKPSKEAEPAESKQEGKKPDSKKEAPAKPPRQTVLLKAHESGRCIDVPHSRFNDGQALHIWNCSGADSQQWKFERDGTLRIKGLCMDVAAANWNDGTNIQLARCSGNPAQQFRMRGTELVNPGSNKCVDVAEHRKENGTRLQLWKCNGQTNQRWSTA